MPRKLQMIDRSSLRELSEFINDELKPMGDLYGVTIKTDGGKYSNGPTGSIKLEICVKGVNGEEQTVDELDFKKYCSMYGFKPDDLDAVFTSPRSGEKFTIVGLDLNKRKYPIIATNAKGKRFKFEADLVRRALLVERGER